MWRDLIETGCWSNEIWNKLGHNCSVSIGVVLFVNHETSQEYILDQADAAMYQAKYAGRNRVRFYEETARSSSQLRTA